MRRKPIPVYRDPFNVRLVDGEVAITGPSHMHGSMTPDAAEESAERLRDVAKSARVPPSPKG